MAGNEQITEPKVGQLYHLRLIEEDHILRLQITVNHVQLMTVGYCTHNLHDNKHSNVQELPYFTNKQTRGRQALRTEFLNVL